MYQNRIVTSSKGTVKIISTCLHWDAHVQISSYHAESWNRKKL